MAISPDDKIEPLPTKSRDRLIEIAEEVTRRKLGRRYSAMLQRVSGAADNHVFDCNNRYRLRIQKGSRAYRVFRKERWCTRQAMRLGIACPKILHVGQHQSFAFCISKKVTGTMGTCKSVDYPRMWTRLGEYSRKLNTIRVNAFGKRFNSGSQEQADWISWIADQHSSLFDETHSEWLRILSNHELDRARGLVRELANIVAEPLLAHGDMSESNTIIDDQGRVFLIDWGNAGGYPAFWDLAQVCAWHVPNHGSIRYFCKGLGLDRSQFFDLRFSIERIQVWRWLSSIRWAMTSRDNWTDSDFVQVNLRRLKEHLAA